MGWGVKGSFRSASLDVDDVANKPQFELIELLLPSLLESLHPLSVSIRVGKVYNEPNKIIAVENIRMAPMSLDFLRLVAGGSELIDNFKYCFSQQVGWNVATVVELEWEQHLESPPPAAHSSPFP
jgi:hypothetical protein